MCLWSLYIGGYWHRFSAKHPRRIWRTSSNNRQAPHSGPPSLAPPLQMSTTNDLHQAVLEVQCRLGGQAKKTINRPPPTSLDRNSPGHQTSLTTLSSSLWDPATCMRASVDAATLPPPLLTRPTALESHTRLICIQLLSATQAHLWPMC